MDTKSKVGQLFFIGIAGPEIDRSTEKLLADITPGGICLFSRNIRESRQTRALNDRINEILPVPPLISIDQEGGLVDRLRRVLTPMPSAEKLTTADDASRMASIIAEALRLLGFNMNFAPVLDIIDAKRLRFVNGLQSRSFGVTADDVLDRAGAFLTSLQEGGCIGCIKHFPGLGAAEVDSHEKLPEVKLTFEELSEFDLLPFSRLIKGGTARAVMVAHADYSRAGFSKKDPRGRVTPSSLNHAVVSSLLREELGFDGVVITDDLEMGAIVREYGIGEACRMAIAAGVDMFAICANEEAIYEGFRAVYDDVKSGKIPRRRIDESFTRIMNLKASISLPLEFDQYRLDRLSAEIMEIKQRLG